MPSLTTIIDSDNYSIANYSIANNSIANHNGGSNDDKYVFSVMILCFCCCIPAIYLLNVLFMCIKNSINCCFNNCLKTAYSDDIDRSEAIINNIIFIDDINELVKNKIKTEECSICLSEYSKVSEHNTIAILTCNHVFHSTCINEWIGFNSNTPCPLCKNKISGMKTLELSEMDVSSLKCKYFYIDYI